MKDYNENCNISLAKKSIESIVLKEIVDYSGNVLVYIIKFFEQDQDFADLTKKKFKH